jgi:hypothetical protein
MWYSLAPLALILAVACVPPAFADAPPPDGSKPLSDIVKQVEQTPNFRYFDEVELDSGLYEIKYYTKDGVKHKIYVDPMTGKPR